MAGTGGKLQQPCARHTTHTACCTCGAWSASAFDSKAFLSICATPAWTQFVLAITKKMGQDAGGLWTSQDGGKSWGEKTAELNGGLRVLHLWMLQVCILFQGGAWPCLEGVSACALT